MKIGTVKIEALKLMFANGMDELTITNENNDSAAEGLLLALSDPRYADYLRNMNGAINRCFTALESAKVLPTKRHTVSVAETTRNYEVDLSTVSDLDDIQRVVLITSRERIDDADYNTEGNYLILPYVEAGDSVRLVYYPRLTRLTYTSDDNEELPVPQKIASIIPYYVKYDLYRNDDEAEANEALRQFQRMLADVSFNESRQTSVDTLRW